MIEPSVLGLLRSFNPRARAGRDTIVAYLTARAIMFQSTRPRGARRGDIGKQVHALAVSIHAPARGATLWWFQGIAWTDGFNPRARAGRDVVVSAKE